MVLSIGSTSQLSASTTSTTSKSTNRADGLGKQDFLKILITQLQNQDPMKPMEDREFITQLAQFSSLETLTNLDKRFEALAQSQALGQAAGIIGKHVEAKLEDGTTVTGTVTEVRMVGGSPRFVINGKEVDPSLVTTIGGAGAGTTPLDAQPAAPTFSRPTAAAATTGAAPTATAGTASAVGGSTSAPPSTTPAAATAPASTTPMAAATSQSVQPASTVSGAAVSPSPVRTGG